MGNWMEIDMQTFQLMWLILELEFWTHMVIPSNSNDCFLVCSLLAAWRIDSTSMVPSGSQEEIEIYHHPNDVPWQLMHMPIEMQPTTAETWPLPVGM